MRRGRVLKTNFSYGRTHDFKLFKQSRVIFNKKTTMLADTGYQGIQKMHTQVNTPHKKKRNTPLTKEQKEYNHELSSKRIVVENVFALLKRFKIITDKYRNRRSRFGLRFNLIAGVHNYEKGF